MLTEKRLDAAYQNAVRAELGADAKVIVFSDCHRGDDSASDEFTRNQAVFLHALEYYYARGYTYVEAGDGDELWEYSDFKTIRLAHSDVFLSIQKFFEAGRLVLLYGNHNIYLRRARFIRQNYFEYYDEYTQEIRPLLPGLRAHEALVLRHAPTGREILVVHGHQGDLLNDQLWPVSMLMMRYFWRFMHVVGFQNPASPARNLYKQTKLEVRYKRWITRRGVALICGHTHRPKFSERDEPPYFNSGCCIRTKGITGVEIAQGAISLVQWRVRGDAEGRLCIERSVTRGPVPLTDYALPPRA